MEVRWVGPRGGPCEGLAKWVIPVLPSLSVLFSSSRAM